jgi:hypothetical protein
VSQAWSDDTSDQAVAETDEERGRRAGPRPIDHTFKELPCRVWKQSIVLYARQWFSRLPSDSFTTSFLRFFNVSSAPFDRIPGDEVS